jgi:pimeloyl-ACP methyl ester carboxylesterase
MDYALMAADLAEFINEHGLTRAGVLGHSMGGKTAMQFALLHPKRLAALVVVDIAPRTYTAPHEQIFAALLSLDLPAFQARRQIEEALASAIPELAVRQFLLKNLAREPGGSLYWKIGLREIHQNYERLNAGITGEHPFEGPTLFIRGEKSDYVCEEDLPLIRSLFPCAELRTIPGTGHRVHVGNPIAFEQALIEFLDRVL